MGTTRARLVMIELGELDESDLPPRQLRRLAEVFQCSTDWLIRGEELVTMELPAGYIAQRSQGRTLQGTFDFAILNCPHCGQPARGCRCDNCGRSLE